LTDPANGQVSDPQTTFGSDATYDCVPGYTVIGNSVRTCQADGDWSGEEPVCESKLAQIRIVSSLPLEDWYQN